MRTERRCGFLTGGLFASALALWPQLSFGEPLTAMMAAETILMSAAEVAAVCLPQKYIASLEAEERSPSGVFCVDHSTPEIAEARGYLLRTARPGDTMRRQGPALAIERLHPEFVVRLANAIGEARAEGLQAGIFSAYRPPAFGVGGFSNKFNSLHSYGLAVDMYGISAPGSADANLWHAIAARHGISCPYGAANRKEWNHCQPTPVKMVASNSPLRQTIAAEGPRSLETMFQAGTLLIANPDEAIAMLSSTALEPQAKRITPETDTSQAQPPLRSHKVEVLPKYRAHYKGPVVELLPKYRAMLRGKATRLTSVH